MKIEQGLKWKKNNRTMDRLFLIFKMNFKLSIKMNIGFEPLGTAERFKLRFYLIELDQFTTESPSKRYLFAVDVEENLTEKEIAVIIEHDQSLTHA